jgi:type III pantothenate kinase
MALAIDNPHELGADRIANGVAAYRRHGGPCLVVDFGTSTNFDAVSADGAFLGGAIAPGIEISVDALIGRAARLFKVDLVAPERAVGKNTVESLQSGIVFGTVAMVDGLVQRIVAELGPETTVIATGGLAGLVCRFSQTIHEHDPFLTLDGLRVIHELNVPSTRSG